MMLKLSSQSVQDDQWGKKVKRYKKSDDTREKILSAARSLFYELGYYETSVKNISEKAQVNRALISYHFGSKGELAFAVADELIKNLRQQLNQAHKEIGESPELLVQLAVEFRHFSHLREINSKYMRLMVELSWDNIMTFSSAHGGFEITDKVCAMYGLKYDDNEKKLVHFSIASTISTFIILHEKELIDCAAEFLAEKQIEMYMKIFGFNNEFMQAVIKKSDILYQKVELSIGKNMKCRYKLKEQ